MGSKERVKFAEEKRASVESGGRPWLYSISYHRREKVNTYRTRSVKANGCNGLAASLAT